jgi:hypothetical protein
LAIRPTDDFVGRAAELDRLIAHATSDSGSDGILALATPGAGATELLKQTYDRLFHDQRETIPFYFAIRKRFDSAHEIGEHFLTEFIRQLVAFRRHDSSIVRSAAALDELAELSLSVSGIWIDRLITTAQKSDGRSFIRTCLSAPARAAAHGDHAFVMIDDVHRLMNFDGGRAVFEELKDVFSNAGVRFVISGYRRFLHGQMDCDRIAIDNFGLDEAGRLVEVFTKETGVSISEPSQDLIATQLGGNAALTRLMIRDAADIGDGLERFEQVEKTVSTTGGSHDVFRRCSRPSVVRRTSNEMSSSYSPMRCRAGIRKFLSSFGIADSGLIRLEPSQWSSALTSQSWLVSRLPTSR